MALDSLKISDCSKLSSEKYTKAELSSLVKPGGLVPASTVQKLLEQKSISVETLMLYFVPIAAQYSVAPVSNFEVGAVVAGLPNSNAAPNFYLGANAEFENQSHATAIHAEQSAVANAYSNHETGISMLAVSAAPCGHCRQFLNEIPGTASMPVIFKGQMDSIVRTQLEKLLPTAFGPSDLGIEGGFMLNRNQAHAYSLSPSMGESDPMTRTAAEAAVGQSYAPYTGDIAGIALQMNDGEIISGVNIENAAFNPGLDPLRMALSEVFRRRLTIASISRAVLVEIHKNSSQKNCCRAFLSSIAPQLELEYYSLSFTD